MKKFFLIPLFALGLAGCAGGQLTPDARVKLQEASNWAHRASTIAHATVIGISANCADNPSQFCAKVMPVVTKADGALVLFDQALAAGDKVLANTDATDAQIGAALADLIKLERDVESYIAQLKVK